MKKLALLLLAALLALSGCAAAENLCVDFFDVGKADAMLITTPAGERILIDAATHKQGGKLVERLRSDGVSSIDVMVITHYDNDHVGGADRVLEDMRVGTVIMPVYDKESKQHTQFEEALAAYPPQETLALTTGQAITYTLPGGLALRITAAHERDYGSDEENDFSLAVRLTYGETRFLFTGDAENARQKELLAEGDVACDVLKVPYHGRYESISPVFLAEAAPKIAYIHDDEENPADWRVLETLEGLDTQVYCSRSDGSVSVYSDGQRVWAE